MAEIGAGLNIAKNALGAITPDGVTERIKFTRFSGDALEKAIVSDSDKVSSESVTLKVNPQSLTFTQRKIIQKIQTSSPNRFVVFDWGHELTVSQIEGMTGNLIPETLYHSGLDAASNILLEGAALTQDKSVADADTLRSISSVKGEVYAFQHLLAGAMTYTEILDMSPKYRRFRQLEALYRNSDADNDVITMEVGEEIYRGYFEEFSFIVSADSPWNWNYSLVFIILANLTALGDPNKSNYPGTGVENS